ncbi:MAG: MarR family transcriptional regulator [Dehalococcoidia bacterium]|nr:MAG: MarR family transcriptional regulator [Dehalococcoidia bacterium]
MEGMVMKQELLAKAIEAYGRALAVADPIRLQFWDNRGLTMTQLRLMYLLHQRDEQTITELAEQMYVRKPTITGLTDRLTKHKLIRRLSDRADRRVVRIALTKEGRRVLGEIEVASRAYLDRIFGALGEDKVEDFIRLMEEFSRSAEGIQQSSELQP